MGAMDGGAMPCWPPVGGGCWLRPPRPLPALPALSQLQRIPASPDCGAVASAAGPHVLPRAGRRRGGRCGHPGWAGCGDPPWPPFHSGGAAEVLRCWEGAGRSPSLLQQQRRGRWVQSVGQDGMCVCVCVHTHVHAYRLPPSRGAAAVVPPLYHTHLPAWGHL